MTHTDSQLAATHPKPVPLERGGIWHVAPAAGTERFDYSSVAPGYQPRGVTTAEWQGDLGIFVADQISRIGGLSEDEYRRYARTLALFLKKAIRSGFDALVRATARSGLSRA